MDFIKTHKLLSAVIGIIALTYVGTAGSSQQQSSQVQGAKTAIESVVASPTPSPTPTPTPLPIIKSSLPPLSPLPKYTAPAPQPYCSNGSYINVDGERICSPDYNSGGGGITCADGTKSHATHRQGACSHHGGIKKTPTPSG